jgi:hypothetical protein
LPNRALGAGNHTGDVAERTGSARCAFHCGWAIAVQADFAVGAVHRAKLGLVPTESTVKAHGQALRWAVRTRRARVALLLSFVRGEHADIAELAQGLTLLVLEATRRAAVANIAAVDVNVVTRFAGRAICGTNIGAVTTDGAVVARGLAKLDLGLSWLAVIAHSSAGLCHGGAGRAECAGE